MPADQMTATMTPDQVWDAFLGAGHGALFRSAMALMLMIPPDAFDDAVGRIERETTVGPLLNPSGYTDGRRFDNARDYVDVLAAAGRLRAVLAKKLGRAGIVPDKADDHDGNDEHL